MGGLLLSKTWIRSFGHGYTEPLATGQLFLAVERALDERPCQALVLAAAVSLTRPEAWPLVVAYGAFLVWRRQVGWRFGGAIVGMVPALWILPDWLSSGDLFHASEVAKVVVGEPFPSILGSRGTPDLAPWLEEVLKSEPDSAPQLLSLLLVHVQPPPAR